jgi:hypothetical protein
VKSRGVQSNTPFSSPFSTQKNHREHRELLFYTSLLHQKNHREHRELLFYTSLLHPKKPQRTQRITLLHIPSHPNSETFKKNHREHRELLFYTSLLHPKKPQRTQRITLLHIPSPPKKTTENTENYSFTHPFSTKLRYIRIWLRRVFVRHSLNIGGCHEL